MCDKRQSRLPFVQPWWRCLPLPLIY